MFSYRKLNLDFYAPKNIMKLARKKTGVQCEGVEEYLFCMEEYKF